MRRAGSVLCIITFIQCLTAQADYSDADKAYDRGDHTHAFNEYKTFAERGDARAQLNVGWMYYYGEGVRPDKTLALVWYRKAAEQGDVTSMFNLAYGYDHGEGVRRDLNESQRWYGKVAEQKNAFSRLDFERLTKTFLIPETAQARVSMVWAEQRRALSARAAEEVSIAAAATVVSEAIPPRIETSPTRMVKKDNDGSALSPPANSSVEMFRDPRLERIRREAESGDKNAQVALGWIYSSGKGIPADKAKAATWYRLAAEKGNINAQVALGWMYYDGQGCGRNLKESALWYAKAAAQGNIKARQMLKKIAHLLRRT